MPARMVPGRNSLRLSTPRSSVRKILLCLVATTLLGAVLLFLVSVVRTRVEANRLVAGGVEALNRSDYPRAVTFFQEALRLHPGVRDAQLNLAIAYARQYVPGGDSPKNLSLARQARQEFERVIEQDPGNRTAMESIGSLYYRQGKYDEARHWYEKLAAINPDSAEAYAMLAAIAWRRVYPALLDARLVLGMKSADPGPLVSSQSRETLSAAWSSVIDEGFGNASKAIAIDPEHVTALRTTALLHRARADLASTRDQYQREMHGASEWMRKALEAERATAQRNATVAQSIDRRPQ